MTEELENLRKKLERKDMVIEELTERLEALKNEKGGHLPPEEVFEAEMKKRVNDLLSNLQSTHTTIKNLTAERKERDDEIDRLSDRVRDLLRLQEEASKRVTMANVALAHCVKVVVDIHDYADDETIKEKARDFLISCGSVEAEIEPEMQSQQELLPVVNGAEPA